MPKCEAALLLSALACLAAAGCGGGSDDVPTAPSPPPAAPAFVFVLTPPPKDQPNDAPVLSAFQVTSLGELRLTDRQVIEYARVIAADPRGRFLFVGGGRRQSCGSPCHGPSTFPGFLRSYSVDPNSGVLSQRDERTMPYDESYGSRLHYQVQYLAASEDRVYAWLNDSWRSTSFRQFQFDAPGGSLSAAPRLACDPDGAPSWLLASGSRLLIGDDGSLDCWLDDGYGMRGVFGVFAPKPEDGGRLHRIANATLARGGWLESRTGVQAGSCVAVAWSEPQGGGLTAFALDSATGIASERNTVGDAAPAALAGTSDLVAAAMAGGSIELHSLTPTCDISSGSVLASATATSLAFHPSGQFLYVVQDGGIRTYALRPGGPWEARGFVEGVVGDLVIVPSPAAP